MQEASSTPTQLADRQTSVDSTEFFQGDQYDQYDDCPANQAGGGGGKKTDKRRENRGGGGGSGSIYSTKHTRLKEAQKEIKKTKAGKK